MALAIACILIGLLLAGSRRFRELYFRLDWRLFRRRRAGEYSERTDRTYRDVGIFCVIFGLAALVWALWAGG